jgi:uncharacterized Zn finger protein
LVTPDRVVVAYEIRDTFCPTCSAEHDEVMRRFMVIAMKPVPKRRPYFGAHLTYKCPKCGEDAFKKDENQT